MNLLVMFISLAVLGLIIVGIVFVGVYVVLPIVLVCVICSAIAALVKSFMPESSNHHFHRRSHYPTEKIIDVEFEEIK